MAIETRRVGGEILSRFRSRTNFTRIEPVASEQSSTPGSLTTREMIVLRGMPVWLNLLQAPKYASRAQENPVEVAVAAFLTTLIGVAASRYTEEGIKRDRNKKS